MILINRANSSPEPKNIAQLILDVLMCLAQRASLGPQLGSGLVLIARRLKIMDR